ncbi:MAG: hypothetical protein HY674_20970 [Chloroflexi bacterium]|nr:hypothetical protein [Chloroflexota bacterium]
MSPRPQFHPAQAVEIARAFEQEGVDYLFIGKSAAILMGYPAVTQDVDVFPDRTPENGRRMVQALRKVGFDLDGDLEQAITGGKDFVQIKTGPFDVDLVFAPDGISSFSEAKARSLIIESFRVANLRDVIASKRASGREKDLLDLSMLERFRAEYEKQHPQALKSAAELAAEHPKT